MKIKSSILDFIDIYGDLAQIKSNSFYDKWYASFKFFQFRS